MSVIVLNYNGRQFIEDCVRSVLANDLKDAEILVVDNCSTDGSWKLVSGRWVNVTVLRNKENLGFAEGNNVGLRKAKGDIILTLNVDAKLHPSCLQELYDFFRSHPDCGACQCKVLFMDRPTIIDSSGNFFDFLGFVSERGRGDVDSGQYDNDQPIMVPKGCAFSVRRSVLMRVGLFDRRLFFNFEDVDLAWRIWLAGYEIRFCHRAIVYHRGSYSGITKRRSPGGAFHYFKNIFRVKWKNYDTRRAIISTIGLAVVFSGLVILLMARKRVHLIRAVVSAVRWNLVSFRDTYRERTVVQKLVRCVSDQVILDQMKPVTLKRPGLEELV